MDQQLALREVARLEAVVRSEQGAAAFASLGEAHRRAGHPEQAERVAREGLRRHPDHVAGRVALGLALLDQGRLEEARGELVRVLDAVPDHPLARRALAAPEPAAVEPPPELLADLAEGELETAFRDAESQRDEMIDADGVAEAVVRAVVSEEEEAEPAGGAAPFATRTMADLLERQGHPEEAEEIRTAIARGERTAPAAGREGVVRTLEGWLDNLRKGRR